MFWGEILFPNNGCCRTSQLNISEEVFLSVNRNTQSPSAMSAASCATRLLQLYFVIVNFTFLFFATLVNRVPDTLRHSHAESADCSRRFNNIRWVLTQVIEGNRAGIYMSQEPGTAGLGPLSGFSSSRPSRFPSYMLFQAHSRPNWCI